MRWGHFGPRPSGGFFINQAEVGGSDTLPARARPVPLAGERMPKRGVLILLVASSIGLCSCNGPVAGLSVPAVHAQSPIGFVNQSISQRMPPIGMLEPKPCLIPGESRAAARCRFRSPWEKSSLVFREQRPGTPMAIARARCWPVWSIAIPPTIRARH